LIVRPDDCSNNTTLEVHMLKLVALFAITVATTSSTPTTDVPNAGDVRLGKTSPYIVPDLTPALDRNLQRLGETLLAGDRENTLGSTLGRIERSARTSGIGLQTDALASSPEFRMKSSEVGAGAGVERTTVVIETTSGQVLLIESDQLWRNE
jgi:hypothetical protein